MHGQRREEYKARMADPKISAALGQKAMQWNKLSRELLSQKQDPKFLPLTAKLLQVNPDPNYIWNLRRNLLAEVDIETELQLSFAGIERNPKAYAAWFHRKWTIQQMLKMDGENHQHVLDQELQNTALLLSQDERNFHCWNYRRFIVGAIGYNKCSNAEAREFDGSWDWLNSKEPVMGAQIGSVDTESANADALILNDNEVSNLLQQEWDFSTEKISQNFSNCSAFHYRSKLLPLITKSGDWLTEELELVHSAMFTEPDDQTAWWYYRFLLNAEKVDETSLKSEVELLQDLVDAEDGQCKWGLLALVDVCEKLNDFEKRTSCLEQLLELDPDRAKRYQYMMAKRK